MPTLVSMEEIYAQCAGISGGDSAHFSLASPTTKKLVAQKVCTRTITRLTSLSPQFFLSTCGEQSCCFILSMAPQDSRRKVMPRSANRAVFVLSDGQNRVGTASTLAPGAQVKSEDRKRRQWGMANVLWGGQAAAASLFSMAGQVAAVFSSKAGNVAACRGASSDAQTALLCALCL